MRDGKRIDLLLERYPVLDAIADRESSWTYEEARMDLLREGVDEGCGL
jgi:hypothetical protein